MATDLLEVRPCFSSENLRDRGMGSSELFGDLSAGQSFTGKSPDFENLCCGKDGSPSFFASEDSAVFDRISDVVFLGSPAKMSRIETSRGVAGMQSVFPSAFWQSISSGAGFSVDETRASHFAFGHSSVSVRVGSEGPEDAIVSFEQDHLLEVFSRFGFHESDPTKGAQ